MPERSVIEAVPVRVRVGVYIIRWLIIIGVLLESQLKFITVEISRREVTWAAVSIAAVTLIYSLVPKWRLGPASRYVVSIMDILFVSVVVFYSGGLASPFYPLYYVTLISAAVVFGTRGAMISAVAVGFISLIIQASLNNWRLTELLIIDDVVQTFPYLFLIAVIAGALRDRIEALHETALALRAQQAVTKREMELAREVQQALLPQETPEIAGVEMSILYLPAREVGGDLYEFYPIEPDRVGIAVADVAGKGVPAALTVSSAKYGIYEHYRKNLAQMADELNRHLLSLTTTESFITMVYGILNVTEGKFDFFNAGHMPPIVVKKDGSVICGDNADIPLGVMDKADFSSRQIDLFPGDTLVLYTDGVTDALSSNDGLTLFQTFLHELAGSDISTWGSRLVGRIGEPRHVDDLTMLTIKIKTKQ